jgi:hypothetical protein
LGVVSGVKIKIKIKNQGGTGKFAPGSHTRSSQTRSSKKTSPLSIAAAKLAHRRKRCSLATAAAKLPHCRKHSSLGRVAAYQFGDEQR